HLNHIALHSSPTRRSSDLTYSWDSKSTYVQHPPYFEGMSKTPSPVTDIKGARLLAILGDKITTDHISPAGSIKKDGPAGKYLMEDRKSTRLNSSHVKISYA